METIEHQEYLRDQFMKENHALKDKILKIEQRLTDEKAEKKELQEELNKIRAS